MAFFRLLSCAVKAMSASSTVLIRCGVSRRRIVRVRAEAATTAATKPVDDVSEATKLTRRLKLARGVRFIAEGTCLSIDLGGALPELSPQPTPSSLLRLGDPRPLSLMDVRNALEMAAADPRIVGVFVKVSALSCGWAKLGELRSAVATFRKRAPRKFSVAYLELAQERELYVASAFEELYAPESAYVSIRGLSVSAQFLRGVLDKVGVEPQVKRIGKYKSAGDQLMRTEMSDAQREVLTGILAQLVETWSAGLSASRGRTRDELTSLLTRDAPAPSPRQLAADGWLTGVLYADELKAHLAARTGGARSELRSVDVARYLRTKPQALGLRQKVPCVALISAQGGISRGRNGSGDGILSEDFISAVRRVRDDPRIKALLLRIDSPGGDALASDLMWRELRKLGKPIVASLSDVAASGGYFLLMACDYSFSNEETLTGSIGVITGKFNLRDLYKKVGLTKETLSFGRYAEVDSDIRSMTKDEDQYFAQNAQQAYESFRDKAAYSRGITVTRMEELAQGRVWTGAQAVSRGLVDAIGGFDAARAYAHKLAGCSEGEEGPLVDFSRPKRGPFAALFGGAAAMLTAPQRALARLAAVALQPAAPQAAVAPMTLGGYKVGAELGTPEEMMLNLLGAEGYGDLLGGAGCATSDPSLTL